MVEIKNVNVYNLERAVVASGNAMRLEPAECAKEEFERGLERMKRLVRSSLTTDVHCHDNALTGILVSFDLKYPQYFTKQLQRYHFVQYVSSTSMMHTITKMDFDKCCNKYVSVSTKAKMNRLVFYYNKLQENSRKSAKEWQETFDEYVSYIREIEVGKKVEIKGFFVDELLYELYMRIISECPMGAELYVHVTTNYKQLQTIYFQRKNHKLKEDWGEFCGFVESLPYAKELIICNESEVSND